MSFDLLPAIVMKESINRIRSKIAKINLDRKFGKVEIVNG